MGDDWSHLFPSRHGGAIPGRPTPKETYTTFQADLAAFSKYCDAYDEAAASRVFPENFPLYVLNPARLETSISV